MEEEKRLYPFRFCALQNDYIWGSETFRAADLGYRDSLIHDGWLAGNSFSEIMDTYMDRVSGQFSFDLFGRQFPLCIRTIKVNGKMPLRVHPDDETALDRYDLLGKEKLWYVADSEEDAAILLGWNRDTNASEMIDAFDRPDRLPEMLNRVRAEKGMLLHIPSGTVHAAVGKLELLEIAEASPLDFCLHSWGEERSEEEFDPALSGLDALDFIDYKAYSSEMPKPATQGEVSVLLELPQFTVKRIELRDGLKVCNGENDGFSLFSCVQGRARVLCDECKPLPLDCGETALVPAECEEFVLEPADRDTILLETSIPARHIPDRYIDKD